MSTAEPSDAYMTEPANSEEPPVTTWNKLALTAFFIQIAYSLFLLSAVILHADLVVPVFAGLATIVGIVFGHISLTKFHRKELGRGYGIAALVIGYAYIAFALASILLTVLLIGAIMIGFSGG